MTRAEAADELGLAYHTIVTYAREFNIPFSHASEGLRDEARADVMASMYRGGNTLEEIGDLYGVTRERVRQIIKKQFGMTGGDGGASAKAEVNRARLQAQREARCQRKYGCTLVQRKQLVAIGRQMVAEGHSIFRTPTRAFSAQRSNARKRGIEWKLTLWEWWQIWQKSGRWAERGLHKGGYVMCRFGDVGAYEVGNVYVATLQHNGQVQPNNPYRSDHPDHDSNEAVQEWKKKARNGRGAREGGNRHYVHHGLPRGVTRHKSSGSYRAQARLHGKNRYLGSFSTPEEAHLAYLAATSAEPAQ